MAIQNLPPKPSPKDIQPEIDKVDKKNLHKTHKRALSHLRLAYCKISPLYSNHTTQHIFRCSAQPTNLCIGDGNHILLKIPVFREKIGFKYEVLQTNFIL